MTAETLMLAGGVTSFALTLYWVRSRELREKYAVAWVLLATGLLVVGLFPGLVMRSAEYAHLSYGVAVLFAALTLIYLFAFAVSVSLTHQYRRTVRLTQHVALLEERVRELERAAKEKGAAVPSGESPCGSP
jgi:hypothetical protein